jgi:hypothetical protein
MRRVGVLLLGILLCGCSSSQEEVAYRVRSPKMLIRRGGQQIQVGQSTENGRKPTIQEDAIFGNFVGFFAVHWGDYCEHDLAPACVLLGFEVVVIQEENETRVYLTQRDGFSGQLDQVSSANLSETPVVAGRRMAKETVQAIISPGRSMASSVVVRFNTSP